MGSSERTLGITYVALSRIKKIQDLVIEPVTLERLQAVKKLSNFKSTKGFSDDIWLHFDGRLYYYVDHYYFLSHCYFLFLLP